MRAGLIAQGAVLPIIGWFVFMIGYNNVQDYQTTLGVIGRYLSSEAQQKYQMYQLMEAGGGILALVGLVLVAAGLVGHEKHTSKTVKRRVIARGGQRAVRCPVCGCALDITTQSEGKCPECKTPIEVVYEG